MATPAKKPAAKKVATPKATKAPAKKPAAKKPAAKKSTAKPTPEQRYKMVAEAAYYIAERNGFGGNSHDYWLMAEAQIAAMLKK